MAVIPILEGGIAIAQGIGDVLGIGGGKTYDYCGQEQDRVAQQIRQFLTTQDRLELAADARKNVGPVRGSSPEDLAFHFLGGDDCVVTSQEGKAWSRRVAQRLQLRRGQAASQPNQTTGPVGSGSPDLSAVAPSPGLQTIPVWMWGIGGLLVTGIIALLFFGKP